VARPEHVVGINTKQLKIMISIDTVAHRKLVSIIRLCFSNMGAVATAGRALTEKL
jgi:hypothetical protein